jgi:hypothetical protein
VRVQPPEPFGIRGERARLELDAEEGHLVGGQSEQPEQGLDGNEADRESRDPGEPETQPRPRHSVQRDCVIWREEAHTASNGSRVGTG